MPIKIYGDPGSGSLRRVTSAAAIMGTAIERVRMNLFKGESHTPEFLTLNPHGLTPVMVDDETVLYEASAINIYLAEKAGSDLLGANERERHQVLQWMFWSGEQWRVFSVLLFNERVVNRILGKAEEHRRACAQEQTRSRGSAGRASCRSALHRRRPSDTRRHRHRGTVFAGDAHPRTVRRIPASRSLAAAIARHGAGLGSDEAGSR